MKFHLSDKIAEMIAANILGTADDCQQKELTAWLAESGENRTFWTRVNDPDNLRQFLDEVGNYDADRDWHIVSKRISGVNRSARSRTMIRRLLPYAAAFAVAVLITGIIVSERSSSVRDNHTLATEAESAILPGSAKAVITTETGEVFNLDAEGSLHTETFIHEGDVLDYAAQDASAKPSIHTLHVPRGGEYRLVLSDGSHVWLNSESELRYPSVFTSDRREVELSGEAYFIVASDAAHPFIVKSGDLTTTAIGTSFNVRTYDNYQSTLLTGKVMVRAGAETVHLEPGQQAVTDGNGISIRQVNAADYVSWKDGRFVYRSLALRDVMADMARWYDIDVTFADERTANIRLTANIKRYEDFLSTIAIVEQAAYVNIDVSGREVSISRK